MSDGAAVCPGDRIGAKGSYLCGAGVYTDGGHIYSSRLGFVRTAESASSQALPSIQVLKGVEAASQPQIGDIVTARVLRISTRFCVTEILIVGSEHLKTPFQGTIRPADVRASETSKVVMHEAFRPGDLIRAEVLSLGTMREYYLSTAKSDLGVIWAKSLAGAPMVAISWHQMRCPVTNQVEQRKVAKPS